ncbi:MAG: hypothetical protein MUP63_00275 [Candidatus Nanohaloarchaeota archaeon QJJ-7]|nr:hypothetical protein [Candidatus Nanohaloarchaeota archaeon QJJ-7]
MASFRKGVSPLIAAVLLIAFTMAVAAILTSWFTTFTEDQSQQLSNQSEQMIQCSYAGIDISNVAYDSENSLTEFSIDNTGTVDFNNISVVSFQGSQVQGRTYINSLSAGQTKSGIISGTEQKPDSLKASSKQCPEISSTETQVSTF